MKVIYLAGPIRRGCIWGNVAQADDAMLDLMKSGYSVINPMLSCWSGAARVALGEAKHAGGTFDDRSFTNGSTVFFPADGGPWKVENGVELQATPHALAHGGFRELGAEPWLTMDLELVKRSDAVLRLPGDSSGADGEVEHAIKCGVPVFYRIEDLKTHFGDQA